MGLISPQPAALTPIGEIGIRRDGTPISIAVERTGVSEDDGPEYDIDFREQPGAYEIGRGEHGVFKMQPYKDELLPLWTITSVAEAESAAAAIFAKYEEYKANGEFPGMDLARKYLKMGWTRSLRYAKYPGGKKYNDDGTEREPQEWYDEEKREISLIYREYLDRVRDDPAYEEHHERWETEYG